MWNGPQISLPSSPQTEQPVLNPLQPMRALRIVAQQAAGVGGCGEEVTGLHVIPRTPVSEARRGDAVAPASQFDDVPTPDVYL